MRCRDKDSNDSNHRIVSIAAAFFSERITETDSGNPERALVWY